QCVGGTNRKYPTQRPRPRTTKKLSREFRSSPNNKERRSPSPPPTTIRKATASISTFTCHDNQLFTFHPAMVLLIWRESKAKSRFVRAMVQSKSRMVADSFRL